MTRGVLLDLDGTLVDSVYLHVVTWKRALLAHGHDVPSWRIHAGIGMGSDRLVPWLLGEPVEDVDAIAGPREKDFLASVGDLRRTDGAEALLADLESREVPFLISTSATEESRDALLEVLGRPDLGGADADAVDSSKPAPDLLELSLRQLGLPAADVTLIGDSPWDARAAAKLGLACIAVRCGGFADEVLRDAGAVDVVDAPRSLVGRL